MKKLTSYLLLMLGLSLGGGCSISEETRVIARVNGKNISSSAYENRLHEYRMGPKSPLKPSPVNDALKKRVLNEMIEEAVLLEEAERRKLTISPQELEARIKTIKEDYPAGGLEKMLAQEKISLSRFRDMQKHNLLLERVVQDITQNIPQPSPADIELYYQEHKADFTHQGKVHLKQIVVKTEEDGERILEELKKGIPFEVLAKNHSYTPEAAQGGDLGWISLDVLPPPIVSRLKKLKKDQISEVISTDYGFHIISMLDKKAAQELSLEEATGQIIPILTRQDREEKFAVWRRSVLSKAKIERNHELLAKIN